MIRERIVPIGRDALKYIKMYTQHVRNLLEVQPGHEDYVFLNRGGTKLSRVMIFQHREGRHRPGGRGKERESAHLSPLVCVTLGRGGC